MMAEARASCAALYNLIDLERECESQGIKISEETNYFMLKVTLRKLNRTFSQKLVQQLVQSGELKYGEDSEFEVEGILDHYKEDETEFFLVKWKGWSHVHNTWEPRDNLDCDDLIEEFFRINSHPNSRNSGRVKGTIQEELDREQEINSILEILKKSEGKITPMQLLGKHSQNPLVAGGCLLGRPKRKFRPKKLRINCKAFKERKQAQLKALKAWEKAINSGRKDPAPIIVENLVDLEGPPANLEFIHDYKVGKGVDLIMDDPIVGCTCEGNCLEDKSKCCPASAGTAFPYNRFGRVRIGPGYPIYECNKRCLCDESCYNRVVQKGRMHKLCIFRTSDGRGWGVKTLQKIKKGSFVMEYLGEIITNEEAEERGMKYDAEGMTYLFDLDYQDNENAFTVDAGHCGNVAHFVNHSCDPNLVVYGVWINNLDPRLPRIALFAKKEIKRGEELTFDYTMKCDAYEDPAITETELNNNTDSTVMEVTENPPVEDQINGHADPGALLPVASQTPSSDVPLRSPTKSPPKSTGDDFLSSPLAAETSPRTFGRQKASSALTGKIWCLCNSKNCKKFIF